MQRSLHAGGVRNDKIPLGLQLFRIHQQMEANPSWSKSGGTRDIRIEIRPLPVYNYALRFILFFFQPLVQQSILASGYIYPADVPLAECTIEACLPRAAVRATRGLQQSLGTPLVLREGFSCDEVRTLTRGKWEICSKVCVCVCFFLQIFCSRQDGSNSNCSCVQLTSYES